MDNKIKLIGEKINSLESEKRDLSKKVIDNQKKINDYENILSEKQRMENGLEQLKNSEVETSRELMEKLIDDKKDLEDLIRKYEEDFEGSKDNLDTLSYVKELFSSTGIRSTIINRIISLFNKTLDAYLMQLEAPCKINFDENFDPEIKTMGGIDISFDNLSSGEQHRVNTALAFTFKDILRIQNQISFNVSIIDEVFDSSIDKKALKIYGVILSERLEELGESSYIISHRSDFHIDDSKEIMVEKVDGVSNII